MPYEIGQIVNYKGELVEILYKSKGGKTNKPNYHSRMVFTGYKSNPPTYGLSNGATVRGNKLIKINSKN